MQRRMPSAPGLVALALALALAALTMSPASGMAATTTPIHHVVVLFQENQSFDHYFGTYPNAANLPGEIPFTPVAGTPSVNGLSGSLLTNNPNAANPKRVAPADVLTRLPCDNNHAYQAEQTAMNGGLMNKFVESTQGGGAACQPTAVMDYFDGNTVTGLWNYAQQGAISDAHFGTTFGPSTIGAINLISGTTRNPIDETGHVLADSVGSIAGGAAIGNRNPLASLDGCSGGGYGFDDGATNNGAGTHKNVGDLLNTAAVTWGWFQGGFTPKSRTADAAYPILGRPSCSTTSPNASGAHVNDYDAHHNPFAYFKSTSNPEHLPPTAAVGTTDQANHQYDTSAFNAAAAAGTLPAVSYVKAPASQDGHPGYSDPLSEQRWLVDTVNKLQASPNWHSTAIFIAWDDSDGWYDHVYPQLVRGSATGADVLNGPGSCGTGGAFVLPISSGRCGYGPRLPLVVLSPYARTNYVDHTVTDQSSILKFIEDNWTLGQIGSVGGDVAADATAGSLNGLFDFVSPPKAAPPALDPATGALPGTARIPTPTPKPTPTPAPAASPAATPTTAPAPAPVPEAKLTGKRIAVAALLSLKGSAKRCPKSATATAKFKSAGSKPPSGYAKLAVAAVTVGGRARCKATGTVKLGKAPSAKAKVSVRIKGTGVVTRTVAVSR